ncbi:MAG: hypothetical protein Q8P13_05485 [bacterium]|nr:hypothetical protein [bacterium]
MSKLTPRHREILLALKNCGSRATTRQIAVKAGLTVNGVSQSLNNSQVLSDYVAQVSDYQGGDTVWELVNPPVEENPKKVAEPNPQMRFKEL